ncbi:hypothetical protein JRO89_XSUnG0219100 [Xanthoceras sorbifolium]|uniref:Uncharacterized protein n=1 Tax=Xanthoceras sorbifolium TaxID=99658 RepID=A0ABQ8GWY6_9ROSI|nr:hypothetical protein JRO89_XSUnG0219100 [Xanthoceras sorbifolium]
MMRHKKLSEFQSEIFAFQGVPSNAVPRRDKPRRVDLVCGESSRRLSLDCVPTKKKASGVPLSRPAFMAQINTKINPDYLRALEGAKDLSKNEVAATSTDKPQDNNIPKLLVLGGAIILACSLDGGLLPKAFIFSMARRFANMGKKL